MINHLLSNYLCAMLVAFVAFIVFVFFCLLNFIKTNPMNEIKIFKRLVFVFKWWLIGKTHCDTNDATKRFYKVLHKIFWGFIIVSVVLTLATILQIIGGVEWN